MFEKLKRILGGIFRVEIYTVGFNPDECLRKLEKKIGLPEGDLSIKTASNGFIFSAMRDGMTYHIVSNSDKAVFGKIFDYAVPAGIPVVLFGKLFLPRWRYYVVEQ